MDTLPPPPLVADGPESRNLMDAIRLWQEIRSAYPMIPDAQITLQPIQSPMANGGSLPDGRQNIMLQDRLDKIKWDDDARRQAWIKQLVYHEAGHSLQSALGDQGLSDYWQARGLPGTPSEQSKKAWDSVGGAPNGYQMIHERLPDEMFAEDFAGTIDPSYHSGAETTFGIPYNADAMRNFYSSRSLPPPALPTYDIPGLAPGVNPFASLSR